MRIAVTGAAGRLGRSVVAVLRSAGHDVQALDRSIPAGEQGIAVDLTDTDATHAALRDLAPDAVIHLAVLRSAGHEVHALDRAIPTGEQGIAVDLTDTDSTHAALRDLAPDAVIHLAAIAVPFTRPEREIFTTNTGMAFDVMEAAAAAGATNVLVASSPTVLGYGAPDWSPTRLPLDESVPSAPTNAYALSKVCIEETIAAFARSVPAVRFAAFRPCYVIAPEEWEGSPTQQGHTVVDRLRNPALAAVSLFNYVDARDVGEFVDAWLRSAAPSGARYFIDAGDALALRPLDELLPQFHPGTAPAATALSGTASAFDSTAVARDTGWVARRSWRTELSDDVLAALAASEPALDGRTSR